MNPLALKHSVTINHSRRRPASEACESTQAIVHFNHSSSPYHFLELAIDGAKRTWDRREEGQQLTVLAVVCPITSRVGVALRRTSVSRISVWDSDVYSQLCGAKSHFSTLLNRREAMLREKARVKWLSDGDRNSRFAGRRAGILGKDSHGSRAFPPTFNRKLSTEQRTELDRRITA
ncbi:unnamed protein product [Dovyalis caffra]|uniref:Uncharacterized protein n=1 Tax=Dovyalis caffra TaxID=77055 RepID=A0AAV1R4M3_9ROSI|nr:unnamed protein product [Dovyalis caffra]CAK7328628.1 unnamed protein product [Dovyalis caffra]CAK7328696.1 unnamed protein product [Dovyalis caffra]